MSKKATSKYSVVGSSALYDLAAELEAQKEKLHQQAGSSTSIKGLKRGPKVCVAVPAGGKLLPAGACRPPLRAEDEELTPSPPLPPAAGAPLQAEDEPLACSEQGPRLARQAARCPRGGRPAARKGRQGDARDESGRARAQGPHLRRAQAGRHWRPQRAAAEGGGGRRASHGRSPFIKPRWLTAS
jgi:hypothetical protein